MKKEIVVVNDCRGNFEEEIIEKIMESRGIENKERFLNPTEDDISNPFDLYRMDEAVKCTVEVCSKDNPNVLVYADVDTDGITSAAIVYQYLNNAFNVDSELYINDGKVHGVTDSFLESRNKKYDLVIIVDSLNNGCEMYEKLKDKTENTIVLDHHHISDEFKYDEYVILVSSQRKYSNTDLSGAGVCLQFARALDEEIGAFYSYDLFDLAATGIVADMMDMSVMENRAIAKMGFLNIVNKGIKKICGGFKLNSTSVSFSVAPMANSALRMNKNKNALMCICTNNDDVIKSQMRVLNATKKEQGKIVDSVMTDIKEQIEEQKNENVLFIILNDEVPREISGLIGNKILGDVQKPLFVLKEYKDYYGGSLRAVGVDDFRKLCEESNMGDFSGHESAAGAAINKSEFENFKKFIRDKLENFEFKNEYTVDALVNVDDVTSSLVGRVSEVDMITGKGFPRLKFAVKSDDFNVDTDGEIDKNYKHTVITFPEFDLKAIKWNDRSMVDKLEEAAMVGDEITLIGCLEFSPIYGYGAKIILDDVIVD